MFSVFFADALIQIKPTPYTPRTFYEQVLCMAISTQHLEELRHLYLFEHLDDTELGRVLEHATLLNLPSGNTLFSQNDACRHFYVVHSGMVKLFRMSSDGSEKVMELMGAGEMFAEAVMFVGKYPVHAVAVEDSCLFAFDCKDFRAQLHDNIELCFRLMSAMSRRMHGLINEIDQLTLHSGTERLARYLLEQLPANVKQAPSIRLLVPKQTIASRLGIKPETFSRVLAKLRHDGLIEVHDDTIMIKDAIRLGRMAG